jgi:predicted enzyme related to lactoylglutathione lyase
MTSDYAAAFNFYSQLFGWKVIDDMDMGPMGTYRIFGLGELQMGGMMTKPKDAPMPTCWMFYTEVSDLDGAMNRAKKDGATVLNGPMDVPGGRMAQMMDPQGGAFALHEAAKK